LKSIGYVIATEDLYMFDSLPLSFYDFPISYEWILIWTKVLSHDNRYIMLDFFYWCPILKSSGFPRDKISILVTRLANNLTSDLLSSFTWEQLLYYILQFI